MSHPVALNVSGGNSSPESSTLSNGSRRSGTSARSPSCSATGSSAQPPPRLARSCYQPTGSLSSSTAAGCSDRVCSAEQRSRRCARWPADRAGAGQRHRRTVSAGHPRTAVRPAGLRAARAAHQRAQRSVQRSRPATGSWTRPSSRGGRGRDDRPARPGAARGPPAAKRAASRAHLARRHGRHPHRASRRPPAGAAAPRWRGHHA